MKLAPATVAASAGGGAAEGKSTSGAAGAWYSNMSPNDVKLPVPALTPRRRSPSRAAAAACPVRGGASPARDGRGDDGVNRHAGPKDRTLGVSPTTVVARASDAVPPPRPAASTGTNPAPWIVTSVPPVAGPRVGSRPSTSPRGAAYHGTAAPKSRPLTETDNVPSSLGARAGATHVMAFIPANPAAATTTDANLHRSSSPASLKSAPVTSHAVPPSSLERGGSARVARGRR